MNEIDWNKTNLSVGHVLERQSWIIQVDAQDLPWHTEPFASNNLNDITSCKVISALASVSKCSWIRVEGHHSYGHRYAELLWFWKEGKCLGHGVDLRDLPKFTSVETLSHNDMIPFHGSFNVGYYVRRILFTDIPDERRQIVNCNSKLEGNVSNDVKVAESHTWHWEDWSCTTTVSSSIWTTIPVFPLKDGATVLLLSTWTLSPMWNFLSRSAMENMSGLEDTFSMCTDSSMYADAEQVLMSMQSILAVHLTISPTLTLTRSPSI